MNIPQVLLVRLLNLDFIPVNPSISFMANNVVSLLLNLKYFIIFANVMHLNINQYHCPVEPVETTSIQMNNIIVANHTVLTPYQTVKEQIHKKTMYILLCICCVFVLGGMVFSVVYDPRFAGLSFLGLVFGAVIMLKTSFN